MRVSKNFLLKEYMPYKLYKKDGDKCIRYLDPKIVDIAQAVRELFDQSIVINGRFRGKTYKNSGYRNPRTSVGAERSQHKFGRAIDLKFYKLRDYDEARQIIIANFAMLSKFGLTAMEDDTRSWLHLDCRWTLTDDIKIIPFQ